MVIDPAQELKVAILPNLTQNKSLVINTDIVSSCQLIMRWWGDPYRNTIMLTFFIGDLLPIIVIMLWVILAADEKLFQKIKPGHLITGIKLRSSCGSICFYYQGKREMIFADTRLTLVSLVVIVGVSFSPGSVATNFLNVPMQKHSMCINCRFTYHWIPGVCSSHPIYGDSVSTGLVVAIISIILTQLLFLLVCICWILPQERM